MDNIGKLLNMCIEGMQHTFYVYGYPISIWQIFILEFVAIILCFIIGGFLFDWW